MHVQLRLFRYRVEERVFGRCFIVWKAYHGERKRWVSPLIFDINESYRGLTHFCVSELGLPFVV